MKSCSECTYYMKGICTAYDIIVRGYEKPCEPEKRPTGSDKHMEENNQWSQSKIS